MYKINHPQTRMYPKKQTTGFTKCLGLQSKSVNRHRRRYGSADACCGVLDGRYTEGTINLQSRSVVANKEDVHLFDVNFDIELHGDIAHTFVLKGKQPTDIPFDQMFKEYSLNGKTVWNKMVYSEGMTFSANSIISYASGWTPTLIGRLFAIPLMLRETVDSRSTYLPILTTYGDGEARHEQQHQLQIKGVNGRELAESLTLDVDYVYLDTPARNNLAQRVMYRREFVTFNYQSVVNFLKFESGVAGFDIDLPIHSVTGIIIKSECALSRVKVFFDFDKAYIWHITDQNNTWKKVGLKNPEDGSILIPFSRNMWINPENATVVDFNRMDSVHARLYLNPDQHVNEDDSLRIEIIVLGLKTRIMSGGNYLIDDQYVE